MTEEQSKAALSESITVGWREWLSLPQLGLTRIKAKVDTGARTSAIHAFSVEEFEQDQQLWVRFGVHPNQGDNDTIKWCEALVIDQRNVTDSGGHTEKRYVIQTELSLGQKQWPIEVTLTNRDNMLFRMLMKIAVLSRNPKLYSTRRLVEAAEARGHEVHVLDVLRCYMNITSLKPEVHYKGEILTGYDAVIPRIGASVTFYGTAVLRQFEMMNVYPLNESVAISRSRDKLRALQLLSRKGIGLPVTGFAHRPDDVDDLIKMVGGAPLVIKLLEGTQGIGVVLAETEQAAESVIEAFMGMKANILVQEFIKEAGGADIRCFVVGDKVVASMKRQGKEGEFRSNLHRGGSANLIRISPLERATAVRAAKTMGLNVCGVDLLRSNHGPVVMEVNSSPGLEGIENATGKDIASMIIDFIERNARSGKTKTRGRG